MGPAWDSSEPSRSMCSTSRSMAAMTSSGGCCGRVGNIDVDDGADDEDVEAAPLDVADDFGGAMGPEQEIMSVLIIVYASASMFRTVVLSIPRRFASCGAGSVSGFEWKMFGSTW